MLTPAAIDNLTGALVYDSVGYALGRVATAYLDENSGQPTFIAITTNDDGTPAQLAPFHGATLADSQIRLAYNKAEIARGPHVEPGPHLTLIDYDHLHAHFHLPRSTPEAPSV